MKKSLLSAVFSCISFIIVAQVPTSIPTPQNGDFKSVATGTWLNSTNDATDNPGQTWAKMVNGVWVTQAQGVFPTEADGRIFISSGTMVTIKAAGGPVSADQIWVEDGGTLRLNPVSNNAANGITLLKSNIDVYDLVVWTGGTVIVSSAKPRDQYFNLGSGGVSPYILFKKDSELRFVDAETGNGILGAGWEDIGSFGLSNWETGAVFNWTVTQRSPVFAGKTYFQNATPNNMTSAIPIFRINRTDGGVTTGGGVAGSGALNINGVLNLQTSFNLTVPDANKYFRNGITGPGTLTFTTGANNAYSIIVNGATADLGGGPIVTNGNVQFGGAANPCAVTMIGNKTITGATGSTGIPKLIISGTATNPTRINLGSYNLTFTGAPGNVTADANGYIVTGSTGAFVRDIAAGTGLYKFPIGNSANYEPAELNFTTAAAAGTTLASRFVTADPGATGLPLNESGHTINRQSSYGYWQMTASPATTATYDGTFYANNFPNLIDVTKLHLLKRTNGSSNPWTVSPSAGTGTHVATTGSITAAVLKRTGMSGFSEFGLGGEAGVALPVKYDGISAVLRNGNLLVNWSSLTESNTLKYDIELSKDGVAFTKIGSVNSKAPNGNSDTRLDYSFELPMSSATAVLGISLIGLVFGFKSGRRKLSYAALGLFAATLVTISCSKNVSESIEGSKATKYFVRVVSVDNDGQKSYSFVYRVIQE